MIIIATNSSSLFAGNSRICDFGNTWAYLEYCSCSFILHSQHQRPFLASGTSFRVSRAWHAGQDVLKLEASVTSFTRVGEETKVTLFKTLHQCVPHTVTNLLCSQRSSGHFFRLNLLQSCGRRVAGGVLS